MKDEQSDPKRQDRPMQSVEGFKWYRLEEAERLIEVQKKRIAELEAISKALIKTLQISLPNVAAPLRESFELAIAKAKDKLRG